MKKTYLVRLLFAVIASQLLFATACSQILTDPFAPEPVTAEPGGGQPDQDDGVPDQDDGVPDQDDGMPTDPDQY